MTLASLGSRRARPAACATTARPPCLRRPPPHRRSGQRLHLEPQDRTQGPARRLRFPEPPAKSELSELGFARWRALLFEGGFSTGTAQLTKDHTNYLRLTSSTARITFLNSNVLAKLIKSFPSFQKRS